MEHQLRKQWIDLTTNHILCGLLVLQVIFHRVIVLLLSNSAGAVTVPYFFMIAAHFGFNMEG